MTEVKNGIAPLGRPAARAFVVNSTLRPVEGTDDRKAGQLTWRTLISGDRCPSTDMVVGVAEFPPRGFLNAHRHAQAEFYFCLSGSAMVTVDGETLQVDKGAAVFIPGNAEHAVMAGDEGFSILYGFAVGEFADVIYHYRADSN